MKDKLVNILAAVVGLGFISGYMYAVSCDEKVKENKKIEEEIQKRLEKTK